MRFLETPDWHFDNLDAFPFEPNYVQVDPSGLRMHYVDEGAADAPVFLLLHGEPTWSYLYRRMIPPLVEAGFRVIAPDLVGFGRSSKPTSTSHHSYEAHVRWVAGLLDALGLQDVSLFAQDWGSLIGLRLVGEQPGRFARVCIGNGTLPTGDRPKSIAGWAGAAAFFAWRAFAMHSPWFVASKVISAGSARTLTPSEARAYDAPFPSVEYMAGPRAMPKLVPVSPRDPARAPNLAAWEGLRSFERPFLTLFSTGDPIMRGLDRGLQKRIVGAQGQPHDRVHGGHFLQEDSGVLLVERMVSWAAADGQG